MFRVATPEVIGGTKEKAERERERGPTMKVRGLKCFGDGNKEKDMHVPASHAHTSFSPLSTHNIPSLAHSTSDISALSAVCAL